VVERTFAWLHNHRRLSIRWERDPVVHMAFLTLACALICRRYLRGFSNQFLVLPRNGVEPRPLRSVHSGAKEGKMTWPVYCNPYCNRADTG